MPAVAIVQARMGSTRLPGKVLRPLNGRPLLAQVVARLRVAPGVDRVVIATSDLPADDAIAQLAKVEGVACFRGSELDVLHRFTQAARAHDADPVLRVTADCPLVDPGIVGKLIAMFRQGDYDHVGVATGAGALHSKEARYPDGLDAECFSRASLERAHREATHALDREHVTPYIWRNKDIFKTALLTAPIDRSDLRLTVDTEADLEIMSEIYKALDRPGSVFGLDDVLRFLSERPLLARGNAALIGKEQYEQIWKVE